VDGSTLIVFDNGNTRRESDPNVNSRGQVWTLDEQTMTATLVFNADLGNYSVRVGSAQALPNGNYVFTSGAQGEPPDLFGQSIEVRPDGTKAYVLQVDTVLYRSFRVRTLYEGTDLPPAVQGVVANDGLAQRPMGTGPTVAFSTIGTLNPGALALVRLEGGAIRLTAAQAIVDRHLVDPLTPVGAGIIGGLLAGGHYTLTTPGDRVHDGVGQGLDGAGPGVPGSDGTDGFFRLFGDSDGDAQVGLDALRRLLSTLGERTGNPGFLGYLD
jgi:hypothetical protein